MRPPAGVSGVRLGNADERSIITTKEKNSIARRHGLTLFRPAAGAPPLSIIDLALHHAALADLRFLAAMLREIPDCVAFWRVAPDERFSAFAIFSSGSLRASFLRVRMSSLVHERFTVGFLVSTEGLAIVFLRQCTIASLLMKRRSGYECSSTYKGWFDLHSLFNWQLPFSLVLTTRPNRSSRELEWCLL
jgi:hypothetical protein